MTNYLRELVNYDIIDSEAANSVYGISISAPENDDIDCEYSTFVNSRLDDLFEGLGYDSIDDAIDDIIEIGFKDDEISFEIKGAIVTLYTNEEADDYNDFDNIDNVVDDYLDEAYHYGVPGIY